MVGIRFATCIGVAWLAAMAVPAAADEKIDQAAKEAAGAFAKAYQKKDVSGLLAHADVPFCEDGRRIIETKDDLKQLFDKVLRREDEGEFKFEITDVAPLEKMEEKVGKRIPDERRERIVKVLGDEHRIVALKISHGANEEKAYLAVRFKGGKGKVVAVLD